MNDTMITKISVFGTIICILLLYAFTSQASSPRVNIGDIDRSFVGRSVNISGVIDNYSNNNGNIFMEVSDGTGNVKVVLWEDTIRSIENSSFLENGAKIIVIGEVQIYKGEIEILPLRGSVRLA
jgi:DNA/RNA endonuclease YhcR with UshA esterase domain